MQLSIAIVAIGVTSVSAISEEGASDPRARYKREGCGVWNAGNLNPTEMLPSAWAAAFRVIALAVVVGFFPVSF